MKGRKRISQQHISSPPRVAWAVPPSPLAAFLIAFDQAFSLYLPAHLESTPKPMDVPQRAGDSWNDTELGPCRLRDSLLTFLTAASFIDKLVTEGGVEPRSPDC